MHIWNRPWPFIYEHHNRVPVLLSITFDEIATLVWNFYWAHKFVASWIMYSCVYFFLWPFRFVAVPVCGRSGLWPFRFVAVSVCGRSGLWPFRFVAVSVCGRLGFGRFGLWPLWPESELFMFGNRCLDIFHVYATHATHDTLSYKDNCIFFLIVIGVHPLENMKRNFGNCQRHVLRHVMNRNLWIFKTSSPLAAASSRRVRKCWK